MELYGLIVKLRIEYESGVFRFKWKCQLKIGVELKKKTHKQNIYQHGIIHILAQVF